MERVAVVAMQVLRAQAAQVALALRQVYWVSILVAAAAVAVTTAPPQTPLVVLVAVMVVAALVVLVGP
jgi:hypothetical protein